MGRAACPLPSLPLCPWVLSCRRVLSQYPQRPRPAVLMFTSVMVSHGRGGPFLDACVTVNYTISTGFDKPLQQITAPLSGQPRPCACMHPCAPCCACNPSCMHFAWPQVVDRFNNKTTWEACLKDVSLCNTLCSPSNVSGANYHAYGRLAQASRGAACCAAPPTCADERACGKGQHGSTRKESGCWPELRLYTLCQNDHPCRFPLATP